MQIFKTAQGRSSMLLAIKALADNNKQFIITQAFTCSAVPESIIYAGFIPFWLDIELETFSADINSLKSAIKKYHNQFAAIFIQHTFGLLPKYYDDLKRLAYQNKIPIIEDRCHCNFINNYNYLINNIQKNKIAYCYSFENAKPINLGRGGLLLTSQFNKEEINKINEALKYFKKQSILESLLHISIAISYNFFYKTIFYWYLLGLYRKLAIKGFMPSNFNNFLDDFSCVRIGFFQDKLISFFVYISQCFLKFNKYSNLRFFIKLIFKIFSLQNNRYPIYVKDKEKAINFCKKKFIPVKDYFNTPIQPLSIKDYKFINYTNNQCIKAEEASKHIISFDKKPSIKFLEKIIH